MRVSGELGFDRSRGSRHCDCMIRTFLLLVALLAPAAQAETEVDLELVLLVDVSRSMTARELEIQRAGYAAALRSDEVYAAVQSGLLQNIALTYVEWASVQEVIVPWRVLRTRADLDAFAATLTSRFDPAMRRTGISEALHYGRALIAGNDIRGLRRVIDISGDGPNNLGRQVDLARDQVVANGITINGLPLMTREGMGAQWHLDDLDIYYKTCVIGGPGAFVIPVYNWQDFERAVKRKLVLEIADLTSGPRLIRAQNLPSDPRDCRVGEKIWQRIMEGRDWYFNP